MRFRYSWDCVCSVITPAKSWITSYEGLARKLISSAFATHVRSHAPMPYIGRTAFKIGAGSGWNFLNCQKVCCAVYSREDLRRMKSCIGFPCDSWRERKQSVNNATVSEPRPTWCGLCTLRSDCTTKVGWPYLARCEVLERES